MPTSAGLCDGLIDPGYPRANGNSAGHSLNLGTADHDLRLTGNNFPMPTDTSERGLERLICTALTGESCDPAPEGMVAGASGNLRGRLALRRSP